MINVGSQSSHLVPAGFISLTRLRVEKRQSLEIKCVLSVGLSVIWHRNIWVAILLWLKDVDSYSTRGSSTEFVPCKFKSNTGKDSFLYPAALMPLTLESMGSVVKFKATLKGWLSCRWS